MLLIGRFADTLGHDENESVHFALIALAKVPFPLNEVLKQSFWVIVWTSALFFSLVCWDIACDDVGWGDSLWIPLVTMSYPLLLWGGSMFVKHHGLMYRLCRHECDESVLRETKIDLESSPPIGAPCTETRTCSDTRFCRTDNPIHSQRLACDTGKCTNSVE